MLITDFPDIGESIFAASPGAEDRKFDFGLILKIGSCSEKINPRIPALLHQTMTGLRFPFGYLLDFEQEGLPGVSW